MRHPLDIPIIIDPRQRVPALSFSANRQKLMIFLADNAQILADLLNSSRLPVESLRQYLDPEFLSSISRFSAEHQRHQIIQEAVDIVWSKHVKPRLLEVIHDDIVDQAITYTHKEHVVEVPFEEGRESRQRLTELVADALTTEKIAKHPVRFEVVATHYQLLPEDLQPYLNRLFTETVRDIFLILHELEAPIEADLYRFYFNDSTPTKFTLDILQRYQQGNCSINEIVSWALARPDFWFQELLGNCNRNIDCNPNISPDEKLTQKAASYQLLKAIFLPQDQNEVGTN